MTEDHKGALLVVGIFLALFLLLLAGEYIIPAMRALFGDPQ